MLFDKLNLLLNILKLLTNRYLFDKILYKVDRNRQKGDNYNVI